MFSFFFWIFSFCFMTAASAFTSSGLSVERIFFSWLGFEHHDLIRYQMKRTTVTIATHSAFPSLYCLLIYVLGDTGLGSIKNSSYLTDSYLWQAFTLMSTTLLCGGLSVFFYWTMDNFSNHPIRRTLELYGDFEAASADINFSFRTIDKYTEEVGSTVRVILLTDWLIKITCYGMELVHLDHATVKQCHFQELAGQTEGYGQYVQVNVYPAKTEQKNFQLLISWGSLELFRNALRVPFELEPNAVQRRTDTDLFLEVFGEIVDGNPRYPELSLSQDLDECIGCSQRVSNVKLTKRCRREECRSCRCHPLWCLDCMGRWYVSRQDQDRVNEWLDSTAPCPMCRSTFCLKDVSLIES